MDGQRGRYRGIEADLAPAIREGLLRPTEGEAVIEGHPLEKELLAVKRVIGVLPEELPLYERLGDVDIRARLTELKRRAGITG